MLQEDSFWGDIVDFRNLNWKIMIAFFLLVFILLFGGKYLYSEYYVAKPLQETLRETEFVREVFIKEQEDIVHLEVSMEKMDNFQEGYGKIKTMVDESLGSGNYQLTIKDNSNESLDDVWYKIQYAVYEAAAKSNFQEMSEVVQRYSEDAGLNKVKIYLDQQAVYLHLEDGQHYLYKVIARQKEYQKIAGGDS